MPENLPASNPVETPYREIFSRSPVPALITEHDGVILESNPLAQRVLGMEHTSVQGLQLQELFAPIEGNYGERHFHRWALEGFDHAGSKKRVTTRRGIPLNLCMNDVMFRDRPAILIHLYDLTDMIARERSVREGRERFEHLLKQMHEGVWTLDPGGVTVYVNPSLANLLGLDPSQMILRPITKFLHPSTPQADLPPAEFLQGICKHIAEIHLRHADGHAVPCHVRTNTMEHLGSLRDGYLLSVEDLSETISLQQQLFRAQKMESYGRLVGGIAHDFNNLLMALMGRAELVRDELPENTQIRSDAEKILEVGQQGASMIRQLLMFSREESIHGELMDARVWVTRVHGLVERLIPKDIELVVEIDEAPLFLNANSGYLDQVLMNLVINARDAIGERGRITLKAESRLPSTKEWGQLIHRPRESFPRMICVSVHDTGSGMSEETLERIFEPFFSTKPKEKGTGLGLSTAYGLVKRQKGTIGVETEEGHGSIFTLFFPQADHTPDQDAALPETPRTQPKSHKILLVEDEPPVRKVTAHMLKHLERNVLEAASAEDALALWEQDPAPAFEMVFCDILLPGMNGVDMANKIRERNPEQRIAFITGCSEVEVQKFDLPEGTPVIHKPFRLSQLRELLEAADH